ncbi:MAG: hypothetical protein JST91_29715 [Actinobacteria bacterium]|nr:hypothetical protein [Actinomycetota bacterium]
MTDQAPESPEADETADTGTTPPEATADSPEATTEAEPEGEETFSAAYVRQLREENAKARVKAQRADELAHRLHAELVRATGRLADPGDIEYDAEHLDDGDKLTAAIDSLLEAKPHLRSRTPKGEVGQGVRGGPIEPVGLLGLLRSS